MTLVVQGPGFENTGLEIFLWLTSQCPLFTSDLAPKDELRTSWWRWWPGWKWGVWDYFLAANQVKTKIRKILSVGHRMKGSTAMDIF